MNDQRRDSQDSRCSSQLSDANSTGVASNDPTFKGKSIVMSANDNVNWLKKRFTQHAQPKYLKTRQELQKDQEILDVFTKIDFDGSGKIDVGELRRMFSQNGIHLTREEIEAFFALCSTK